MMLRSAAVLVLLAAPAPAPAQAQAHDWYYADSAQDFSNITFIDKDSIRPNAAGNTEADMYSVLAEADQDTVAYRFHIEVECPTYKSRLVTAESFDATLTSQGVSAMDGEWSATDSGSQGETITKFVCSKGQAYPDSKSVGSAFPFEIGRSMLTELRAKKAH